MKREYLRVPLVQRLEYLYAFLRSYRNHEFNEEQAQKAIQKQIHDLEVEKATALGRQRPRKYKGASTLKECLALARHLGLIDQYRHLTSDAAKVFDHGQRRSFLIGRMWQTYPRFRQVVLATRDAEQLDLPFYDRSDTFRQEAALHYDIEFDGLSFETIRYLATQLGLINWYPTEERRQIVYPVASVATFTEIISLAGFSVELETFAQRCRHQTALDLELLIVRDGCYEVRTVAKSQGEGYLVLHLDSDRIFIRDHDVSTADFEQVLWKEYLGLTNMRPRFPVLYPNLRNRVCGALCISDGGFDRKVLSLIQQPQRLDIFTSGGVLNYAANLAHLAKFLPPKTSQGNFIIYLKIDRRSS